MDFNTAINFAVAAFLTLSPCLFDKTDPEDIAKTYAAAQKQADHIVKTGDAAAIAELQAQAYKYEAQLSAFAPMLEQLSVRLASAPR